jgi:hypothetical protein
VRLSQLVVVACVDEEPPDQRLLLLFRVAVAVPVQ